MRRTPGPASRSCRGRAGKRPVVAFVLVMLLLFFRRSGYTSRPDPWPVPGIGGEIGCSLVSVRFVYLALHLGDGPGMCVSKMWKECCSLPNPMQLLVQRGVYIRPRPLSSLSRYGAQDTRRDSHFVHYTLASAHETTFLFAFVTGSGHPPRLKRPRSRRAPLFPSQKRESTLPFFFSCPVLLPALELISVLLYVKCRVQDWDVCECGCIPFGSARRHDEGAMWMNVSNVAVRFLGEGPAEHT